MELIKIETKQPLINLNFEEAKRQLQADLDLESQPRLIDQFRERLKRAEAFLGFNPSEVEQGSDDWFNMRLGVMSASRASKFVMAPTTKGYQGLINELVAEICTGLPLEEMNLRAMEWGKDNEEAARQTFEMVTGKTVHQIGFIYREVNGELQRSFGCSPDGITDDAGVEIKCPFKSDNHIDFILNKTIRPEYVWQVQFSMWVTGLSKWYFCSFDPRMQNKMLDFVIVERDEKMHTQLDAAAKVFDKVLRDAVDRCGGQLGW